MEPLRTLELFDVRYAAGQEVLAAASLLPVLTVVALGGAVAAKRELGALFRLLAIVAGELLNGAVKNLVREPRPASCAALGVCSSFGWPSSHSQLAAFFASLAVADSVKRGADDFAFALLAGVSVPAAALVAYSRVALGYHTASQARDGLVLGVVLGMTFQAILSSRRA